MMKFQAILTLLMVSAPCVVPYLLPGAGYLTSALTSGLKAAAGIGLLRFAGKFIGGYGKHNNGYGYGHGGYNDYGHGYGGYKGYGGYGGYKGYGGYGGYGSYGGYGGYSPYGGYEGYGSYGVYGGYSPYGGYGSYGRYGHGYGGYKGYGGYGGYPYYGGALHSLQPRVYAHHTNSQKTYVQEPSIISAGSPIYSHSTVVEQPTVAQAPTVYRNALSEPTDTKKVLIQQPFSQRVSRNRRDAERDDHVLEDIRKIFVEVENNNVEECLQLVTCEAMREPETFPDLATSIKTLRDHADEMDSVDETKKFVNAAILGENNVGSEDVDACKKLYLCSSSYEDLVAASKTIYGS